MIDYTHRPIDNSIHVRLYNMTIHVLYVLHLDMQIYTYIVNVLCGIGSCLVTVRLCRNCRQLLKSSN